MSDRRTFPGIDHATGMGQGMSLGEDHGRG